MCMAKLLAELDSLPLTRVWDLLFAAANTPSFSFYQWYWCKRCDEVRNG